MTDALHRHGGQDKHNRRSSVSEALGTDQSLEQTPCHSPKAAGTASEQEPESSDPWQSQEDLEANDHFRENVDDCMPVADSKHGSAMPSTILPTHATTEAVKIIGRQVEDSPFMPSDTPVYALWPDPPRRTTSIQLVTVPEDGPSPPEDELLQSAASPSYENVIRPDILRLPKVRTPRKLTGTGAHGSSSPIEPGSSRTRSSTEQPARQLSGVAAEEAFSIDFSWQQSGPGADLPTFNPFATDQTAVPMSPEALLSPEADAFFAMDFESMSQPHSQEIPFGVAHLDFGARNGSGVVGPKIDNIPVGRQADKFEVKEGEDPEVKQLLWVTDNLQEEIHSSVLAFEEAEAHLKEQQALVDRLQEKYDAAAAEEADLDEQLQVMHSKLEAQLLTKLEQEEELRVSGDRLRSLKAEIAALDKSLAEAEEQRSSLERQAAEKKATQLKASTETGAGGFGAEASPPPSPRSNYSSAWETSDSEEGRLDLQQELESPRRSASTIFEDNQAKMKEKGALGGSWLRSVLGVRGRSRLEQTLSSHPPEVLTQEHEEKAAAVGGGHSHFEQPTTAAELAPIPLEIELLEEVAGVPGG